MELNNKEELLKVIDEIQSRLSVIEDGLNKEEPAEDEPTEEPAEEPAEEGTEVESEDEIEKLLEG